MDDRNLNKLLMQKVEKKFYGHDVLYSKYIPQIPASAEREYIRTVRQYMSIVKQEVEKELPHLKDVYRTERESEMRADGATDLLIAVSDVFNKIRYNVTTRTEGFGLRRKLELLANMIRKLTVKEWKRAIKSTLGIDIREDYYLGEFYKEALDEWVNENVDLIKTIPEDTVDKMRDIIYDCFVNGRTTTRMVKDIQKVFGFGRNHAELIARDQTAKLNSQVQEAQQRDAGIEKYMWYTVGDGRVRESHNELNKKIFSWDEPPENSDGRKCHPGRDFQCRCIGRPIFDKRKLNLPFEDDKDRITTTS